MPTTPPSPHRAGKAKNPAPAWLFELFEELNQEYFDGMLTCPDIIISSSLSTSNAFYSHVPGLLTVIGLTSETTTRGRAFASDSLLHEMIHHALATLHGEDSKSHGLAFVRIANRIGGKLGLPAVRADSVDAICWPQSVRSA
jgi:hypothetical protein